MRVSFDLDDTLVCYGREFPHEPRLPFFLRLLVHDEPLRLGSRELMQALRKRGCEIWVYTTSYRSPRLIARWLRCHGIRADGVINQTIHEQHNRPSPGYHPPSKNPQRFGIDLHVDDSEGVQMEGERYGFNVLVVTPKDLNWAQRVLEAVDQLGRWPSSSR